MKSTLDQHEHQFLAAAQALVTIQEAMFAATQALLGVTAYDYWARRLPATSCSRQESLSDGTWRYAFHGLELDVTHLHDGRHARLELGPSGATNVFSGWSIGVFIVSGKPPWPVFSDLYRQIYDAPQYPNFARTSELEESLVSKGMFVSCAPELLELRHKYTRKDDRPGNIIDIPANLAPEVPQDVFMCNRLVLTDAGLSVLEESSA